LVAGGGGTLLADLPASQGGGFDQVDPIYTVPIAMAGVVLLLALVLVWSGPSPFGPRRD
jgi:hypothetical protein